MNNLFILGSLFWLVFQNQAQIPKNGFFVIMEIISKVRPRKVPVPRVRSGISRLVGRRHHCGVEAIQLSQQITEYFGVSATKRRLILTKNSELN